MSMNTPQRHLTREKLYKAAKATAHRSQSTTKATYADLALSVPSNRGWQIERLAFGHNHDSWSSKPIRSDLAPGKEPDVFFSSKTRSAHYSRSVCLSDGSEDFDVHDFYDSLSPSSNRSTSKQPRHQTPTVSLADLPMKVAKPRHGVKKEREYEVVESVQRVIALSDEMEEKYGPALGDDEWEDIYAAEWVTMAPVAESSTSGLRAYASVVRAGGG